MRYHSTVRHPHGRPMLVECLESVMDEAVSICGGLRVDMSSLRKAVQGTLDGLVQRESRKQTTVRQALHASDSQAVDSAEVYKRNTSKEDVRETWGAEKRGIETRLFGGREQGATHGMPDLVRKIDEFQGHFWHQFGRM